MAAARFRFVGPARDARLAKRADDFALVRQIEGTTRFTGDTTSFHFCAAKCAAGIEPDRERSARPPQSRATARSRAKRSNERERTNGFARAYYGRQRVALRARAEERDRSVGRAAGVFALLHRGTIRAGAHVVTGNGDGLCEWRWISIQWRVEKFARQPARA